MKRYRTIFKKVGHGISRRRLEISIAFFLATCVLVGWQHRVNMYADLEDFLYFYNPSAQRAAILGERRLDARKPELYNLRKAEFFFHEALSLDPTTPFMNHDLARVAFLRGDFVLALRYIDKEINVPGGPASPTAFYMRALIKGFSNEYAGAITDYESYLKTDPTNWAAINDYSWVLLKKGRARDADAALKRGLRYFPSNPWLLNSDAIALYEMGQKNAAQLQAKAAIASVQDVTEDEWLKAYPGNDPISAVIGIETFKKATIDNMHSILFASSTPAVE